MNKFYLGLDIGTDSVGLACTDENYDLLRAKGKDLWSVRLFDSAETAMQRRVFRTARRRLQRRRWRINILQELFCPFINDDLFYKRLNNSGFVFEDKDDKLQSPYSLFADEAFGDKEFYKKYKTIYHLRRALIDDKEKLDIRLYYLAIHHIVKYRGHFLIEGSVGDVRDLHRLIDNLNTVASDVFMENAPILDRSVSDDFKRIVSDRSKRLNDKKRECIDLFDCAASPQKKAVLTMILGGKEKPFEIFAKDIYKEEKSFSFGDFSEDEFEAKQEIFGEDFAYLKAMRDIYNYFMFENVLAGNEYISDAMISIYEKHKRDLIELKTLIKEGCGDDDYRLMFKSVREKANYVNYVGYTKIGKKKINVKKCSYKDFLAYVKKYLECRSAEFESRGENYVRMRDEILSEIGDGSFAPKILNSDNGLFPYQINLYELDKILESLCRNYPQFSVKDENGLSIAEKIEKLFTFKIPYFVGPLNTYHSQTGKNSWAVRKQPGRILPWNFEQKIDLPDSNKKFMERMTSTCTYIYGENVLPRSSMVYQAFDVLNQINKLKINERPITVELKQRLFVDLFLKNRRVTDNMICKYLANNGYVAANEAGQLVLSGKDGEFKATMSSYIVLSNILGEKFVREHTDICEDIILWHTLNTDRSIVEKLIVSNYGNHAEIADNIKQLKGLTFKDFGKLSRKFLCELSGGVSPEGSEYTIIGELYNTNNNLNELLYGEQYSFNKSIDEENGDIGSEVTYATLDEMYLSPQVKRGVWQALKMTEECVNTVGRVPDKIFIEVTRGGGEKGKRTNSRQKKLAALYAEAVKTSKDLNDLIGVLNRKTDIQLRQERLYLYFLQLGRCAYSGDVIDLEKLNSDLYDVDHIMPRSITKDDSIDNKVLVKRELNRKKSNTYPVCAALPDECNNMVKFWKLLNGVVTHGEKLMSDKKYSLLTRTKPLDENDFRNFVNRQIVVTGQSAKAVAEILKRKYGDKTKIVYSKASNVNDFKQQFDIIKCRDTNDLHHARDAYLNIVVGNVYDTRFNGIAQTFYYKDDVWYEYNREKLFTKVVNGAWDGVKSVEHIKNVVNKHSMIVTRYSYTGKGAFYDATVYGKNSGVSIPRKSVKPYNDTSKYGGYKSLSTGYFMVVHSLDDKGRLKKTIEAVPVLFDALEKTKPGAIMDYLINTRGLKDPKIVIDKLKLKSLLKYNGSYVWLAGVNSPTCIIVNNAMQWFTDGKTDEYVNAIDKLLSIKSEKGLTDDEMHNDEFRMKTNRHGVDKVVINRAENVELYKKIIDQLGMRIYGGIPGFGTVRKKLQAGLEKFCMSSVIDQTEVLYNCIQILRCNGNCADLSGIGGGKTDGRLFISNNITKADVSVINLSECGFTEKCQKL